MGQREYVYKYVLDVDMQWDAAQGAHVYVYQISVYMWVCIYVSTKVYKCIGNTYICVQ